jgi:hypothetical protein
LNAEQKKHEIISELKKLASEKGEVPSREEFTSETQVTRHSIRTHFGHWTILLQAAGFSGERKKRNQHVTSAKLPKKTVSDRALEFYLAEAEKQLGSKQVIASPYQELYNLSRKTVACVPDCHAPFVHKSSVEKGLDFLEYKQSEFCVILGDLWDCYSDATFPRSYNLITPKEEHEQSRSWSEWFFKEIRRRCPRTEIVLLLGNHDVRKLRNLYIKAPELEHHFHDIHRKSFTFEGVHTHWNTKEPFLIDDVGYIHGWLSKSFAHSNHFESNIVHGHTHRLSMTLREVDYRWRFSMECGYWGDPSSVPLSYPIARATNWRHGMGFINEFGPNLIPF